MKSFFDTAACQTRAFCRQCRTSRAYRESIVRAGQHTDPEFVCPHGIGTRIGLGDVVAIIATPIARALKLPCIDPITKELKPTSKCAERKAALNRIGA